MKVFISWSGEKSQKLGEALREWLPTVVQAVQPYFTPNDIDKGSRWASEIAKELEDSSVGIICLTRSNLQAPWLMFEAGALAKSIEKARVVPILFDVEPSDLQGPLVQFQATSFTKADIGKLMKTINAALGDNALDGQVLESVFEKWWPDLETKVKEILETVSPGQEIQVRSDREILDEILQLTRAKIYSPSLKLTRSLYGSLAPQRNVERLDPIFLREIDVLDLPEEVENILRENKISHIGDLVMRTEVEILKLDKVGKKTLILLKDVLASKGLSLGMMMEDWPPVF